MTDIEKRARELLAAEMRNGGFDLLAEQVTGQHAVQSHNYRFAISAVIAALTPQWQPIETAPKDVAILVTFDPNEIPKGFASSPGMMIAYWDAYYAEGGNGFDGIGTGWVDAHAGEQCHLHYGAPVYWMPLPAAPEVSP